MNARARVAAVLEVFGVYVAGPFVTLLLIRALGVQITNPFQKITVGITDAELLTVTGEIFWFLLLQYAGWFLLIIPINWWHRRRGLAAYGLTKAAHSWRRLLLAGVATAALAAWPAITVLLIDAKYELGETVPWRQALFDTSWRRWEFWLFMSVLSYAFIPVVEELFFRGYCQRRLAEDWGDGPAIIGTTLLFVFSHSQYLILNAYNVSFIASLLILTIGVGMLFAWTRSLIPCIVTHAIINIPMTPFWQSLLLAAFLIGAVLTSRRGLTVLKHVFSKASVPACVALGLIGIIWAIGARRIEHLQWAAAAMILLAITLEFRDRHQPAVAPFCPPG